MKSNNIIVFHYVIDIIACCLFYLFFKFNVHSLIYYYDAISHSLGRRKAFIFCNKQQLPNFRNVNKFYQSFYIIFHQTL
jgi:hypothetical protein